MSSARIWSAAQSCVRDLIMMMDDVIVAIVVIVCLVCFFLLIIYNASLFFFLFFLALWTMPSIRTHCIAPLLKRPLIQCNDCVHVYVCVLVFVLVLYVKCSIKIYLSTHICTYTFCQFAWCDIAAGSKRFVGQRVDALVAARSRQWLCVWCKFLRCEKKEQLKFVFTFGFFGLLNSRNLFYYYYNQARRRHRQKLSQ